MAKPKVFLVDWLAKARELTNELPAIWGPPGLLQDPNQEYKPDRSKLDPIRRLLDIVKVYLTDRIGRKKPSTRPDSGDSFGVFTDDPTLTWPLLSKFTEDLGMTFTDAERRAFVAHSMLCQVMRDGWIGDDFRRLLPTQIASIQGESKSAAKSQTATSKRGGDRRSPLRIAVEDAIRIHPGEAAFVICARLVGDVVESWDSSGVTYWLAPDRLKTRKITLDRFETIFSEANAAIRAATKVGKRRRSTG